MNQAQDVRHVTVIRDDGELDLGVQVLTDPFRPLDVKEDLVFAQSDQLRRLLWPGSRFRSRCPALEPRSSPRSRARRQRLRYDVHILSRRTNAPISPGLVQTRFLQDTQFFCLAEGPPLYRGLDFWVWSCIRLPSLSVMMMSSSALYGTLNLVESCVTHLST
jgi:hypothetical protein